VMVHPEHHRYAHENPEFSYRHGWMVHSWDDPERVPVIRCSRMDSCIHQG